MKRLPIGIYDFKNLRNIDYLYVDKTGILQSLIDNDSQYFLSRPDKYGKNLNSFNV